MAQLIKVSIQTKYLQEGHSLIWLD